MSADAKVGLESLSSVAGRDVETDLEHAPVSLRTEALGVRYGSTSALEEIDATVRPGRITAVIGPSGCGKSTFLSCFNRMTDLIAGCRTSGSVRVGNQEILDPSCDVIALRRQVGMIFQKPNPFPMSIRNNVEIALREHGVRHREERAERARNALRAVGLWNEVSDRLDASALTLSGGQQQRLCLARALALQPGVLLMDEPCSALDPRASSVVEDLISSLRGHYTLVVVTHNLAQARRIADDAMLLWMQDGAGRLVEQGTAGQLFDAPSRELTDAYVRGLRG